LKKVDENFRKKGKRRRFRGGVEYFFIAFDQSKIV